jgi:hypothetical protein
MIPNARFRQPARGPPHADRVKEYGMLLIMHRRTQDDEVRYRCDSVEDFIREHVPDRAER